ncbi:deoxynucleoside triphosphate triphosphohydrolase SAMHD1 [Paramuricea clavata]|uniref:Deoxynucleoside triphosphate triphosphohydrolase SAMHD1 n=1 Tax=Paramuricea clavata TaxID=317549 RepID=A0A6S7KDE3_PARCT|nr:deoxynucleoside triphosphate triphosphohydrolase SAMHD1 [Paramuricea clavata]
MAEDKTGFNDPIHGYMEFDPLLVAIIHTPCFQRMKDIKQLGASYWIFPGASHNRFEHSLGTAHLAGMMIERLKDVHKRDKKTTDRNHQHYITDEEVLCVKIAALCHDLGHGPFSHVFDTRMKTKLIEYHKNEIHRLSDEQCEDDDKNYHGAQAKKLNDWEHEDASCAMFDHILKTTDGLKDAFAEKKLGEKEQKLIKNIIKGKHPAEDDITEVPTTLDGKLKKWFLFEIVANKIYEVDCDKFDYFARDCHNLGMKSNFDYLRYINNIQIKLLDGDGGLHLCPRDKLVFNIYELFHTRWSLHHRAYQHKTTKAVEEMITDALILLEEKYKFSEAIFDMEKYSKLTDSIFYEILRSNDTDEKTKKAQEILERIQRRKLYKLYGEFQPDKKLNIDDLEAAAEEIAKLSGGLVKANELFVSIVKIHFGKEDQDPVKSVIFYNKDGDIADSRSGDDVSRMLPQKFSEQYVRLYGTDIDSDMKKEIAKECFEKWNAKYKSNSDD